MSHPPFYAPFILTTSHHPIRSTKQQQIPYGDIESIQVNKSCCASCSSVSIISGADGSVLQFVGIVEDHEFVAVVQDHMKSAAAGCSNADEPNDDNKNNTAVAV